MNQPNRISDGLVDRATALNFDWNGRQMSAHPGDTLASALGDAFSDEARAAWEKTYGAIAGVMLAA